jgi:methionine-R-sulfoxide reductase
MPKTIQIFNPDTNAVEEVEPVVRSDAEWKARLTPEQYEVMRRKGTERAFSRQCAIPRGGEGLYRCAACGTALFAYQKKFESGTGWPSFWNPISPLNVRLEEDRAFGMRRIEVACARCGSHLGHVFDDGPPPSGKRYCINTVALTLEEKHSGPPARSDDAAGRIATFAGGCFWGMEKVFGELPGVVSTRVGYTGGTTKRPSYEMVCTGGPAMPKRSRSPMIRPAPVMRISWSSSSPTMTRRRSTAKATMRGPNTGRPSSTIPPSSTKPPNTPRRP